MREIVGQHQVRVQVTNQIQYLLSEVSIKTGINRSVYLQDIVVAALKADLGIDATDLMKPPDPQAGAYHTKNGGLRTRYTAKQPTVSFNTDPKVPSLLFRAARETGVGSIRAYLRPKIRDALARDLDLDPDDIPLPLGINEITDHPITGNKRRRVIEEVPNPQLQEEEDLFF